MRLQKLGDSISITQHVLTVLDTRHSDTDHLRLFLLPQSPPLPLFFLLVQHFYEYYLFGGTNLLYHYFLLSRKLGSKHRDFYVNKLFE